MRTVIAGGHGQIARLLHPILVRRGDAAVALIRKPEQIETVRNLGAEPLVLDLESADVDEVAQALAGADAVVFAAGSGPGSSAERKLTVDRDGAVKLADACERAGVRRYVMVSSMGTGEVDRSSDDVFQVYLGAKADADTDLRGRDLDWTIVHPGRLTDSPATSSVTAGASVEAGEIPRADVAAVVAAVLADDTLSRVEFELVGGGTAISPALEALPRGV